MEGQRGLVVLMVGQSILSTDAAAEVLFLGGALAARIPFFSAASEREKKTKKHKHTQNTLVM